MCGFGAATSALRRFRVVQRNFMPAQSAKPMQQAARSVTPNWRHVAKAQTDARFTSEDEERICQLVSREYHATHRVQSAVGAVECEALQTIRFLGRTHRASTISPRCTTNCILDK